jgi:predicted nucleic acid-binding protein
MATTAAERVLLDTSLLVAASVVPHPGHEAAVAHLEKLKTDGALPCLTPQVCREFLVVLTRQPVSGVAFTVDEALAALQQWTDICTLLEEDEAVVTEWLQLVRERQVRGKSLHDCNLVAVMLAHGMQRVATRNAADFERYDDLITVEPVTP